MNFAWASSGSSLAMRRSRLRISSFVAAAPATGLRPQAYGHASGKRTQRPRVRGAGFPPIAQLGTLQASQRSIAPTLSPSASSWSAAARMRRLKSAGKLRRFALAGTHGSGFLDSLRAVRCLPIVPPECDGGTAICTGHVGRGRLARSSSPKHRGAGA